MRRRTKFQPVSCCDPYRVAGQRMLAVEATGDGHIHCLEWDSGRMHVRVLVIEEASLGSRYVPIEEEKDPVALRAATFKTNALNHGATPDAIRLLGVVMPLTKQEEAAMAEKLKTKGGPKAANKEELVKAAKEAPVGGKKAPAEKPANRKGNPEALKKARKARQGDQEQVRKQKLTLNEKNNPKRAGSRAFDIYGLYKTCKTVGAFLDAGGTMADIKYDSGKGFITVG